MRSMPIGLRKAESEPRLPLLLDNEDQQAREAVNHSCGGLVEETHAAVGGVSQFTGLYNSLWEKRPSD